MSSISPNTFQSSHFCFESRFLDNPFFQIFLKLPSNDLPAFTCSLQEVIVEILSVFRIVQPVYSTPKSVNQS